MPHILTPARYAYLAAAMGAMGGLLFGYDTGVISGALLFINDTFHINPSIQEAIVSSVVLGALVGALCSGKFADFWGRKYTLMMAALAFTLGTLLSVFAHHIPMLIVGRFIVGMAIGISSYTTPLYISEMAPATHRGSMVLLNAITITGGEAIAFLVDYFLAPFHAWRWMFAAGLIPAFILLLGMIYLPETPRWLVLKGRSEQARKALSKIRPALEIEKELFAIHQVHQQHPSTAWHALFSKRLRPVLVIALGLGIFQQFFGINTLMYYGPTIFAQVGFKSTSAGILATFGMGIVNTFMSILAVLVIDWIGRRKLLLLGSFIAAVSLGLVAMSMNHHPTTAFWQWTAVLSLVTFIMGYCISVGSLFWLMIAEIFPLNIRGVGMSFATAVQWGANFIVSMSFLTILYHVGAANTFWIYTTMCALCFAFVYYLVPETKGISLEEIEHNLDTNKPSRELGAPLGERAII